MWQLWRYIYLSTWAGTDSFLNSRNRFHDCHIKPLIRLDGENDRVVLAVWQNKRGIRLATFRGGRTYGALTHQPGMVKSGDQVQAEILENFKDYIHKLSGHDTTSGRRGSDFFFLKNFGTEKGFFWQLSTLLSRTTEIECLEVVKGINFVNRRPGGTRQHRPMPGEKESS